MTSLKIASWNVNSVRARIAIVERFLREEAPDVLCLQETKAEDKVFPAQLFRDLGYVHQKLNGQRMHHGVAILSKVPLNDEGRHDWQDNGEARHVGARLPHGIRLENVYVPAGGDIPDRKLNPKFGQKLDFIGRMTRWSEKLAEPTLIVGDFNVAPLECDVWSHKALIDVVSHTPVEVEALTRLQQAHDWVSLEFYRNAALYKNNPASPGEVVMQQVLFMSPGVFPVTVAGLLFLWRRRDVGDLRHLALQFAVMFALLVWSGQSRPDRIASFDTTPKLSSTSRSSSSTDKNGLRMSAVNVAWSNCSSSVRHNVVLPVPMSPVRTMKPSLRLIACHTCSSARSCDSLRYRNRGSGVRLKGGWTNPK